MQERGAEWTLTFKLTKLTEHHVWPGHEDESYSNDGLGKPWLKAFGKPGWQPLQVTAVLSLALVPAVPGSHRSRLKP
jgi:hypothetical protein